ncbi:MAG: hypothetical protein HQL30_12410 [Candidatus Omnitrophica bacterium]|nr:hypothetical protein [Candidatus Omnitrophota bacterium]
MKKDMTRFLACLTVLTIMSFSVPGDLLAASDQNPSGGNYVYSQKPLTKVTRKNMRYIAAVAVLENTASGRSLPFDDGNKDLAEKDTLSGLLTTALSDTGMFDLIERNEINDIIRELNFQGSEWVRSGNADKLGKIYGVDYIVTGKVLKNSRKELIAWDNYTVSLRMYSVTTGEIISSSDDTAPFLRLAVTRAARSLANWARPREWSCRVVDVKGPDIFINAGIKDGLDKRDIFYVSRAKDNISDPGTKEVLGQVREKIALIKVEEILEDSLSRAKVLEIFNSGAITPGDTVEALRIDNKNKSERKLWKRTYD